MTDLASSILAIKSDAQVSINAEDINQIIWHDGNPTNITKTQILAKQTELQAVEDAKEENVKRASGKQKLKDLGLDDAEIKALTGA